MDRWRGLEAYCIQVGPDVRHTTILPSNITSQSSTTTSLPNKSTKYNINSHSSTTTSSLLLFHHHFIPSYSSTTSSSKIISMTTINININIFIMQEMTNVNSFNTTTTEIVNSHNDNSNNFGTSLSLSFNQKRSLLYILGTQEVVSSKCSSHFPLLLRKK